MAVTGVAVAGHFGEWLQGRLGADGPLALVTVACPALQVRTGPGPASVPLFDAAQLARFAADLGLRDPAWPTLQYDMPFGCGAGASTATLVALARWASFSGTDAELARACVRVEGATDPLMLPAPDSVLWAPREGRSLQALPPPPGAVIVGGYWGAPQRTDPADTAFDDIADLIPDWDAACRDGDLARAAALAATSARRCTASRGPQDPMPELARDLGALGHLRAHTGSARGLIFAPGDVPEHAATALTEAGLTGVLHFPTGGSA
ncbi:hypothetical protein ACOXXX_17915 [Thalassococcus sp. BH17M4-6]|uniref:hypothetical protein n=1 Tax=Thalassococcus sp. BH17M4-6 TaxID=3413148 RepID=UPI003BBC766D